VADDDSARWSSDSSTGPVIALDEWRNDAESNMPAAAKSAGGRVLN